MQTIDFVAVQSALALSDTKLARALGVTRQTIRNWRTGGTIPPFVARSLRIMMALRRLDPANDNLPPGVRVSL